jgi:hypothetical protein
LCKVFGEVTPFGVVAGQQDRLISENIFVVFEISVHLFLDVRVLGVELILFCRLRLSQLVLVSHGTPYAYGPIGKNPCLAGWLGSSVVIPLTLDKSWAKTTVRE